ncbi:hypothetical protein FYK55_06345 [Roseiconus nitratireducens]|uniref:3-hydroxyacyl-[acyl-carrier-protein] dehydratase n=1 Tax=Roseiconus nitratireducens TaxID=2605748 RepID=A0A5M6DFV2_9BACT|nr:hypothetical protein [Roseiconus nitratireducens]KAA5545276.1 hypothetical protein FYK55_06345 [Roseiconus nitratireducens]
MNDHPHPTAPSQPTDHQHQFERVEDYLHHRAPYLLIDAIERLESKSIVTRSTVPDDAFFITGHFPGAPILPGAMMQEMTTQTAGILIAARYNPMAQFDTHDPDANPYALGVLVKVSHARYRGFARPGDELRIEVRLEDRFANVFDFKGRVACRDQTLMRNQFQLANVASRTLRGLPAATS